MCVSACRFLVFTVGDVFLLSLFAGADADWDKPPVTVFEKAIAEKYCGRSEGFSHVWFRARRRRGLPWCVVFQRC